jgi:SulP family sulfate permease
MPYRRFSRSFPPLGAALREALAEGYGRKEFLADLWAGLSVGVIALPLSLALAIASGVAPQHGLYTAIVAGALIALIGGSRYNVSGPTAAFVVILHPIAVQHGLGGLLVATFMAGLLLIAFGWGRLGQLIQYIPYPVTTGFTAGIAVVIGSLQLKDFFGLRPAAMPENFFGRMEALVSALPTLQPPEFLLGAATLAVLVLWPKLRTRLPAYLAGAVFAAVSAITINRLWPAWHVTTIADRFSYVVDNVSHPGIPRVPPHLQWPWQLPGPDGHPLTLSFALLREMAGPAFAVAMLGAIESLLCAVVVDGMSGRRHNPNTELVAQGLGNLVAPLFGGIPATGALARTAANFRSGAVSPLASTIHAVFVFAATVALAPLLSQLPMAGLASMLLIVAWNMSEREKFVHILRMAPRSDMALLLICFVLTVMIDMVTAISAGVVLGALVFMHRMAKLSQVRLVGAGEAGAPAHLPKDVRYYTIAGPLFFGAAERAASVLRRFDRTVRAVILDLSHVPTIDITGLVALETVIDELNKAGLFVAVCAAQRNVLRVLVEGGYRRKTHQLQYFRTVDAAVRHFARR